VWVHGTDLRGQGQTYVRLDERTRVRYIGGPRANTRSCHTRFLRCDLLEKDPGWGTDSKGLWRQSDVCEHGPGSVGVTVTGYDEHGGTSAMTISASAPLRVVVLLTSVALALVLLLTGVVVASANDGTAASIVTAHVEHQVVLGDTLWDIAAEYTAAGDDVRDTIHDIKVANELPSSVIVTGQILSIPLDF